MYRDYPVYSPPRVGLDIMMEVWMERVREREQIRFRESARYGGRRRIMAKEDIVGWLGNCGSWDSRRGRRAADHGVRVRLAFSQLKHFVGMASGFHCGGESTYPR